MKKIVLLSAFLGHFVQAGTALVGVWQTDCTKFTTRHSYKTTATFSEDKDIFIVQFFSDQSCASNTITISYDGAYSVGEVSGDGIKINHIASSVKFTLHSQDVVDQYNKLATDGCGIIDWKVDVPQDVSGRHCRPDHLPASGQMIYDIYGISQGRLQFGGVPLRWDMSTEATRPTKLSPIVFQKVE